jgi:hypothetical protein
MTATTENKSRSEQIVEKVDALVKDGKQKSDAYKRVADDLGLKPSSVRGAYYRAAPKATNGSSPRKKPMTTEDHLAAAVESLRDAIANIDREVDEADERAKEAAAEAKHLKATAADRKKAYEQKLAALEA